MLFYSGYPQEAAARVALKTVRDFLEKDPNLVRHCSIVLILCELNYFRMTAHSLTLLLRVCEVRALAL